VPAQPIRGKSRKTRHYFIDMLKETAEVAFYVYWKGNGYVEENRMAEVGEPIKFPDYALPSVTKRLVAAWEFCGIS
jgi:hypothetical protein